MQTEIRTKRWTFSYKRSNGQTWEMTYSLDLNVNIHGHMLVYPVVKIDHQQVVSSLLKYETTTTRQEIWDDVLALARQNIPETVDFSDPR